MARGVSLSSVARATGISASFLALVEKGGSDVTVGRLVRLLDHYDVHIAELFPRTTSSDGVVVRRGEGRRLDVPADGAELILLAPDTNRRMMPGLGIRQPGSQMRDLPISDSDTFVHVLDGSLLIERDGQQAIVLYKGDSAYFDAGTPPRHVTALGKGETRTIWVVTPPTFF